LFSASENYLFFLFRYAFRRNDEICLRDETFDFFFSESEDVECRGLYSSGRESVANFLPDESGKIISDQTVENTPGFLGFAEINVEITRMSDSLFDGLFGDFVEENTLGLLDTASFSHMPSDGLTFTVRVACKENGIAFFDEGFDISDDGFFTGRNDIARNETTLDVDSVFVRFGEISDVTDRSDDLVLTSEIFFYGFGFGGRFDDEEFHSVEVESSM